MKDSMSPAVGTSSTFELEEEEFDEALGLLDNPVDHEETPQELANSDRAWRWWIVTICLVAGFSAFLSYVEKLTMRTYIPISNVPPRENCPKT
jgi:hypothetical protein